MMRDQIQLFVHPQKAIKIAKRMGYHMVKDTDGSRRIDTPVVAHYINNEWLKKINTSKVDGVAMAIITSIDSETIAFSHPVKNRLRIFVRPIDRRMLKDFADKVGLLCKNDGYNLNKLEVEQAIVQLAIIRLSAKSSFELQSICSRIPPARLPTLDIDKEFPSIDKKSINVNLEKARTAIVDSMVALKE